jgi:hypothetical protein
MRIAESCVAEVAVGRGAIGVGGRGGGATSRKSMSEPAKKQSESVVLLTLVWCVTRPSFAKTEELLTRIGAMQGAIAVRNEVLHHLPTGSNSRVWGLRARRNERP